MSDLERARTDPESLLWSELEKLHAGMLGIEGSGQHFQPMAHHVDRAGRRLWFLTKRGTDLVKAMGSGATAHFVAVSKAQDFHACMSGRLTEDENRAFLDKLWNPAVASWFENGKDDPGLMMLALDLRDAAIWASTANTLAFAWETMKANMSHGTPNVGVRNHITFV
jgi:general stress protein 26